MNSYQTLLKSYNKHNDVLTPEFIVEAAALGLSTTVSRLTHVAFIIHTLTVKNLLGKKNRIDKGFVDSPFISRTANRKGTVHPKINICWKCAHPQAIQDVDSFVSSWEQI